MSVALRLQTGSELDALGTRDASGLLPRPVRVAPVSRAAELRLVQHAEPRPADGRAASTGRDRTMVGVLALLACTALFPVSDVAAKLLTATLPPLEVAWLRYLVFVVMVLPVLIRGRRGLATGRPGIQVGRALASALSTVTAIVSLGLLPVADATAIGFVAPVVVTAMAYFLLRERVGPRRWIAAVVGLIGVLIMVRPGTGAFQLATLVPLAGSLFSATSTIATRMARDERPETTLLYSALIGFALISGLVAFDWHAPSGRELAVGGMVGFFAAVASLMQVVAYRFAPASVLAPFSYTQLIWAAALGYLVFGAVPGSAMLAGAVIIAASGIYTAVREARVGSAEDSSSRSGAACPAAV